jgi:CRISPR-associated protein Csd1
VFGEHNHREPILFSFNRRSFESYGREQRQGENGPISQKAAFAYTTALKHLLGRDSVQRFQVGDASTVFWGEKRCDLEASFDSFWSHPPKDDPDRCVKAVKSLYRSVSREAEASLGEETRFLCLA